VSVQKSWAELQKMHRACRIVMETLEALARAAVPGVTTRELDRLARERILKAGAKPAFLGYRGYPATLCISLNEEVVHGIPDGRPLRDGEIVSIDLGVVLDEFHGDIAVTLPVGEVGKDVQKLLTVARESLFKGIDAVRPGRRLGDVGVAIQRHAERAGFSVVRDFAGHGIGRQLHEEPQVPNFGEAGTGPVLRVGMTLAIEPMVNAGGYEVYMDEDGWTVRTRDRRPSAHFEHTVAVAQDGPQVLTAIPDGVL